MSSKSRFVEAVRSFQGPADAFKLNNGREIPCLAYGTWLVPNDAQGVEGIKLALDLGYRHIDTAKVYGNEQAVGQAVRESGLAREDLFVTSKLWNDCRGYEATREAFNQSLARLGLDYLDLYLIHWPNPQAFRDAWQEWNAESWRAMEDLVDEGKIRSLGVSNFRIHHLEALFENCRIRPQVNQISICPGNLDRELLAYCTEQDILVESYSPLGRGKIFAQKCLVDLAAELGKSVAQVVLRWHLQEGLLSLPKSMTPSYIQANLEIFDFELSPRQMAIVGGVEPGSCGLAKDPDASEE